MKKRNVSKEEERVRTKRCEHCAKAAGFIEKTQVFHENGNKDIYTNGKTRKKNGNVSKEEQRTTKNPCRNGAKTAGIVAKRLVFCHNTPL